MNYLKNMKKNAYMVSTSTKKEINNRQYGLDFLKFLAAILITNSHFIPIYKDFNIGLATFGVQGNALFFFVAGYLSLTGLEKNRDTFDNWFKKRTQRLWPAIFIWAMAAEMLWGDQLTWQKILLAPRYWFLQAIVIYYFFFYFVGNRLIKVGGGRWRSQVHYVSHWFVPL